jgi:hypothetical protein
MGIARAAVQEDGNTTKLLGDRDRAAELDAIHARHHPVRHHQVRPPPPEQVECLLAVVRDEDLVAHHLQHIGIEFEHVVLIINQENSTHSVPVPFPKGRREPHSALLFMRPTLPHPVMGSAKAASPRHTPITPALSEDMEEHGE